MSILRAFRNTDPAGPCGAPPGFVVHDTDRARLWLRAEDREALLSLLSDRPDRLAASLPSHLSGRGKVALLALERPGEPPERLVLRPYRRGGLAGLFFNDRFLDPLRARRELGLYVEGARRGLPSLEPVAAITHRCRGLGYRHGILTVLLEGVEDLAAVLQGPRPFSERRQAMRAAGVVIALMHERGFDHPDLNLKNLLVRPAGASFDAWVIDFDRGRFVDGALPEQRRRRNLLRLLRSFVKLTAGRPDVAGPREAMELVHGYYGGNDDARRSFLEQARVALKTSPRIRLTSIRARRRATRESLDQGGPA